MTVETAIAARPAWHALVADDDDDTRILMAGALRRAGFAVSESSNGEELVASFAAFGSSQTIVVSDIGMPKCDGIEATIAVKKLAPRTPVLLVTAFGDPRRLAEAHDAGADQVMKKPLDMDDLVRSALALVLRERA